MDHTQKRIQELENSVQQILQEAAERKEAMEEAMQPRPISWGTPEILQDQNRIKYLEDRVETLTASIKELYELVAVLFKKV